MHLTTWKFMETKLENRLLNSHKSDLISYIKSNPTCFNELIQLSIIDKQPYSWRAAWLIWSCMDKNDLRLRRYVKRIIDTIPERKENQQRELLMILQRMEIKEAYEGKLFDTCTKIWVKIDKNPSLRWNAFKILVAISKKYPGLSKEIDSLAESGYIDSLTAGVKKSILKLKNSLRK